MAHKLGNLACLSDSKKQALELPRNFKIQGGTSFGCLEGPRYKLSLKIRDTDAEGFVKGMERECGRLDNISMKSESAPNFVRYLRSSLGSGALCRVITASPCLPAEWAILVLVLTHDLSPSSFRVGAQGKIFDSLLCARHFEGNANFK